MSAFEWLPLIVKALATAALVVSASVAAERLGPVWGAVIASLPVSTGPAYVFLALQHDPGFVATSALNSAVANGATGVFLITYAAWTGCRHPWRRLGVAVAVWLLASLALQQAVWAVGAVVAMNCVVYGLGAVLLRRAGPGGAVAAAGGARRWFELPLRAALVAVFVSVVVAGSSALGPAATGFAAVFPVSLISLLVILQSRLGAPAAAQVAGKALAPMLGFGAMLLVLHRAVPALGVAAGLGVALASCVLWSAALLVIDRCRPGWTAVRRGRPIAAGRRGGQDRRPHRRPPTS